MSITHIRTVITVFPPFFLLVNFVALFLYPVSSQFFTLILFIRQSVLNNSHPLTFPL